MLYGEWLYSLFAMLEEKLRDERREVVEMEECEKYKRLEAAIIKATTPLCEGCPHAYWDLEDGATGCRVDDCVRLQKWDGFCECGCDTFAVIVEKKSILCVDCKNEMILEGWSGEVK